MRHTLLVLMLGILLASCVAGDSERAIALQKRVDSLTKLLPAKPGVIAAAQQYSTAPTANSYWYVAAAATKQIQEWHTTLKTGRRINWDKNKGRTAFLVPAITLDTLINSLQSKYVVFYIGIDEQGTKEMNLFYTGVKQLNDTTLEEIEMKNLAGEKCVFDLSYPCPQCNSIGIHVSSSGIGGQPPATIFSQVEGGNGTISPDGNRTFYSIKPAVYTFTPDNGYTINKVMVNGSEATIQGNTYTFKTFTGSNEITVSFKSE